LGFRRASDDRDRFMGSGPTATGQQAKLQYHAVRFSKRNPLKELKPSVKTPGHPHAVII